jgi:hypothetical protein
MQELSGMSEAVRNVAMARYRMSSARSMRLKSKNCLKKRWTPAGVVVAGVAELRPAYALDVLRSQKWWTSYLDSRNSYVFCCRYLSMPDTNRFQVLARPKMVHRATAGSRLDYVEFFASHEAEDLRIWRMAAHDLVILFDIVESSELVADLICELHEGTSVTLPGDFSAAQLVLLGYRIPVRKPPRPANLPGDRYAKHTA